MVVIIKKEPDASVVKRVICEHCGATLEFVPKEVKERRGNDYGGGCWCQKFITCPNCVTDIILESD